MYTSRVRKDAVEIQANVATGGVLWNSGAGDKASQLKAKMGELSDAAAEKMGELLDDFNQTVPAIKALGLNVTDFRIAMGVIPELEAKLVGSIDAIDATRIQELIDKYPDRKLTVSMLKALQAASHVEEQLAQLTFKGVEVNMRLGIPPKVSVGLLQ